jgi:hypothetical protein
MDVFRVLFSEPLRQPLAANCGAVADALFRFIVNRVLSLGQVFEAIGRSQEGARVASLLAEKLKGFPALRVNAPVAPLVEEFRAGGPFERADVLEFLGRNESFEAVPALAAIIARPEFADYHAQASTGLNRLTGFAP